MQHNIIQALKQCPLFENMPETDIDEALAGISYKIVNIDKKDIYALGGFPCNHADIVLQGKMVARMVGASGKQMEVIRLKAGDVIAPNFIYAANNNMPVTVETETKVCIFRMKPDTLKALIDTHETIRWNFIHILSDIGSYLASKIKFLSLLTVREKVIFYLRSEIQQQKSLTITLAKSRQHIADSFAIQKFSLMRCLADLANEGIIKINGKEITILDIKKLRL